MSYSFKIWRQPPMAIRVEDVDELARLAATITGPDAALNWDSLSDYLAAAATASTPPIPFVRFVDVLWEVTSPAMPFPYCQGRTFRVLYTGNVRVTGGFASQGYCGLDPAWGPSLDAYHMQPVEVDVYPGSLRDLFVVRR